MNFSKLHPILQEYIHSPFFYCFLFLSITEIFIWYHPIYEIRDAIWSMQIWISMLIPMLTITFFGKVPVSGLLQSHKLVKERRTPLVQRIFMGGIIWGVLAVDVVFFMVGLYLILGTDHPEIVVKKTQFEMDHIVGIIIGATIPLMNYFCYMRTKKVIEKQLELCENYDGEEEFEFAFPFIWMFFIISLTVVVFINR